MKKKFGIEISVFSETDFKGNLSVYYYAGEKHTKEGEFVPKFKGKECLKAFSSKRYADYHRWLIQNWFESQLYIGSYFVKVIEL